MANKVVKGKVLCYVVRDGRLLVFEPTDHSYEEVGIQAPAGSIRSGAAGTTKTPGSRLMP
ncbi:NUDIX hydrolase [Planomonospora sphaerica]|uniref:NUDIX hydrolase n=1 Tax=Planomonospora sphaerica TaxID=161355 RepID=A0A171BXM0_9ACTN|nr:MULTISPECIES: hypothetical protein [Planomonospora]GAT65744.1 NUDIX hydrolase [Planomonospora sphaerica]